MNSPEIALKNDRLLRALAREPVDATPVWIMRQAGRYLPEYRATRATVNGFMALCSNPELACEVTLQPLQRFDLDAAIVFSDILTIPHAMGLGLHFVEGEGPRFESPIRESRDIDELPIPDPADDLGYVMETLRLVRHELAGKVPLIGFTGSPWTLASYMIEGKSPGEFRIAKRMLYDAPEDLHRLLDKVSKSVISYLAAQIDAGAQALMIFDTWGGALSDRAYREFSLNYMKTILAEVRRERPTAKVPMIVYTKGGGQWLESIADAAPDGIGLDWTTSISNARSRVGQTCALQGNLDPCILYTSSDRIRHEVGQVLADFGAGNGHIFNLGHGIHPQIDPEKVATLIDCVHTESAQYHR